MRKLSPFLPVILALGLGFVLFNHSAGQTDVAPQTPLGNGFTYQGRLDVDGAPADGVYDFRFRLYDAVTDGAQVGSTVTVGDVTVTGGLFSALLDFGAAPFDGEARWLEIAVRQGDSDGAYSALSPRQQLSATPYALHALQAGSVDWTDVQNRPSGLDDGDDDTTYTAGAGLVLNGSQFAAQGSPYANVVVVAQSGGDFTSVQAALDSITGAGATNPYLLYVAPGIYEEQVTLKPYVTLEGAGEGTTIIRWTGGDQAPWDGAGSATLVGADNTAVRHLTLESDGDGQTFAVAFYNNDASPSISHVTAIALNASDTRGVANYVGSAAVMSDVTAIAADGGNNHAVTNDDSAAVLTDVTATASGGNNSYGVINWNASSLTILDVTAIAQGALSNNMAVFNHNASPTMTGGIARAAGGNNNRGVFSRDGSVPIINGMQISVLGGVNNHGVLSINCPEVLMTDLNILVLGGSGTNRGVYNSSAESRMSNLTITAVGGTSSIGVINNNSSPDMNNVMATASGATDNYGAYNQNTSSPMIRHSALEGSTNSVYQDGGSAVSVALSQLTGPLSTGLTCFNNYDENLTGLACP